MIVRGRVQGVFFRDTVRRMAESRGVRGWVRNREDGALEAVFEGSSDGVESLVRFCHEGPRGAVVDRFEAIEEGPEGIEGFSIAG